MRVKIILALSGGILLGSLLNFKDIALYSETKESEVLLEKIEDLNEKLDKILSNQDQILKQLRRVLARI